jgi:hypothetical protein
VLAERTARDPRVGRVGTEVTVDVEEVLEPVDR